MNEVEESFRRGWRDMLAGRTYPVSELFDSDGDSPENGGMPLLTTKEVMERTGWPRQWVNNLLKRGKLKGAQLPNGRWLIDEQSLKDYDPKADKGGRPPKPRRKRHDDQSSDMPQ